MFEALFIELQDFEKNEKENNRFRNQTHESLSFLSKSNVLQRPSRNAKDGAS